MRATPGRLCTALSASLPAPATPLIVDGSRSYGGRLVDERRLIDQLDDLDAADVAAGDHHQPRLAPRAGAGQERLEAIGDHDDVLQAVASLVDREPPGVVGRDLGARHQDGGAGDRCTGLIDDHARQRRGRDERGRQGGGGDEESDRAHGDETAARGPGLRVKDRRAAPRRSGATVDDRSG
jgi:hypothetical protein